MGNRFREKKIEEGLESLEVPVAEVSAEESEASKEEGIAKQDRTFIGGVMKVLGGDVLGDKFVLRQIPLLLLCIGYLLLVVGNRYRIESLSREKQEAEDRINYLREQRIQMQKQYQQSVKISQIAEDLAGTGVGITAGPPYAIEK